MLKVPPESSHSRARRDLRDLATSAVVGPDAYTPASWIVCLRLQRTFQPQPDADQVITLQWPGRCSMAKAMELPPKMRSIGLIKPRYETAVMNRPS